MRPAPGPTRDALGYLETVLRYLAQVAGELNESILKAALLEALPSDIGDKLMPTLAETWHEQGLQKGIRQGIEQGIAAERKMLSRQTCLLLGPDSCGRGGSWSTNPPPEPLADRPDIPESRDR